MNNPQISAYMESMGFVARPFRDAWYKVGMPRITSNQAGFLYNAHIASTRKTLEDLQEKLRVKAQFYLEKGYAQVADILLQEASKLDQMISALEGKGDDV
jgi:hypothetical protein